MSYVQRTTLSLSEIRAVFNYDPNTGDISWKVKINPNIVIGRPMGKSSSRRATGYVALHRIRIRISHFAWFYTYGVWPPAEVDHINGDPTDNRLCNLRLATSQQNKWNKPVHPTSKSGLKGAMATRSGRFRSHIRENGKLKYLGYFATAQEAHEAFVKAAVKIQGQFMRSE